MEIPRGNSREDIKARKQIIKDFYAAWIAEHPDKKVYNKSLKADIHVKFLSINETVGHASGTYESTEAVTRLTEILENARVIMRKPRKQEDKNQKMFSRIVILMNGSVKLTVGRQKNTGEYIQYCITVPGVRMNKK
jgi:hypothetical protein